MNPYHTNLEHLQSEFQNGHDLSFVSSYPRSGNTWARHLIADVFLQNAGMETQTELPVHPDQLIPDVHSNDVRQQDAELVHGHRIVKSHDTINQISDLFGEGAYQRIQHLYLVREPVDALVSYYHFHLRYDALKDQVADGVDSFCLRKLDSWLQHTDEALTHHRLGGRIFIQSYEQLLRSPEQSLTSMLSWLAIESSPEQIARAVSHMQFSNLRKKESKNPANPNEYFFRKGVVGSGEDELKPPTIETIRERAASTLESLDWLRVLSSELATR